MVIRLAPDARVIVNNAEEQARARRSSVVESEHLLLAMSVEPGTDAFRALATVELTRQRLEEALDREFEASLAVAGVRLTSDRAAAASPPRVHRLRLSASFKAAMTMAVTAASGAPQIRPAHLLIGILDPPLGTVPRALKLAGVDRAALASRARAEIALG